MRRPPSRPASGSVPPRPRRQATPSTSRIGINGWAPCNCSVRWWSLGADVCPDTRGQKVRRFQSLPAGVFQSALCAGLQVVHLILDNGSTHAPKRLGPWIRRWRCPLKSGFTGCRRMPVGSIRSRSSSARCTVTSSPRTIFRVRWRWRSISRPILMSSIGIRRRGWRGGKNYTYSEDTPDLACVCRCAHGWRLSRYQRYQRIFLLASLELWLRQWEPDLS